MGLIWVLTTALLAFVVMEGISWAVHKYLLHGPLWFIHQTHHRPRHDQWWEANDIVSLFFGIVAAAALYIGLDQEVPWLAGIGAGVTAYGLVYFLLHDIAVHGRVRWPWLARHKSVALIRRGHKLHHRHLNRRPGQAFGLLYVSSHPNVSRPLTREVSPESHQGLES